MSNKIKIETTRFGEIEIDKKKIYLFPEGIPGFPDCKRYCIINNNKNELFKWLQSMDKPEIAFVLFDPFIIDNTYDVFINDSDIKTLNIKKTEDVIITIILTIPKSNPKEMTANMKAPIIFNIKNKKAKQLILEKNNYPLEFPVWNAISENIGTKG